MPASAAARRHVPAPSTGHAVHLPPVFDSWNQEPRPEENPATDSAHSQESPPHTTARALTQTIDAYTHHFAAPAARRGLLGARCPASAAIPPDHFP
ncbi:hypothetical protein HYPSUDRAFT_205065 [Hypholoma sublateritium FD-334 SS-4]|uniref:Uncharacterized protein n=1 Tax=Hypholoma sublateritium (strain FD-334 SS-4) TaxID=945553 RepID=A0A0D2PF92_HYPSF|nr:hypothetical protein HYPSUDRAFT_205065 [Hypholoma sublateritium FD-334 SS-4]